MRCPDCGKFVSYDTDGDPDLDGMSVNEKGEVTVDARIENACADCGTCLKSADFSLEGTVDLSPFRGHVCPDEKPQPGVPPAESLPLLDVEEVSSERTERVEGSGRGARTFYGVSVEVVVKCGCGKASARLTLSEEVQASDMDEQV